MSQLQQQARRGGLAVEMSPAMRDSLKWAHPELAAVKPVNGGGASASGQGQSIFALSAHAVRELESLCQHLPATGHALCAQLAQHMRLILPPRALAGMTTVDLSAAAHEQSQLEWAAANPDKVPAARSTFSSMLRCARGVVRV